jgi:hypothetical protein
MKLVSKEDLAKENGKPVATEQIFQVRELLFGETNRQIDARLEALKNENEQLRKLLKETEDKLTQLNNTLANKIKVERDADDKKYSELLAEQHKMLSQRIKNLEDTKVDRGQIGQAFLEWGSRVQQIVNK